LKTCLGSSLTSKSPVLVPCLNSVSQEILFKVTCLDYELKTFQVSKPVFFRQVASNQTDLSDLQETSDELFSSWHGSSVRISKIAVDCFLNKIEVLVFQVAPRRVDKRHLDFRISSKLGRRFSRWNSDVSDELPDHVPNSDKRL
jgi:hypothetical protein